MKRDSQDNKKVAVLVSCFDWYENRLKYIEECLYSEGYDEVRVLTSDFNHIEKKRQLVSNDNCELIHVMAYKKNLSIKRLLSHYIFAVKAYSKIRKLKPQFLYVLVPPNRVAFACARYKKKNKSVKLIFDIIDLWPESLLSNRGIIGKVLQIWSGYRDNALRLADYVFTECNLYQENLKDYLNNGKYSTLYLCKDKEQNVLEGEDNLEEISSKDSNTVNLCYLGSINNIIDIDSICNIILAFLDLKFDLVFHIIGDGESKEKLISRVGECGVQVKYYGRVFDEKEKTKILGKCDFGINCMKKGVRVGLTIKSIDYFMRGIPIINNIPGDTWNLVDKLEVGLNFDGNVQRFRKELEGCELAYLKKNVKNCYSMYFSTSSFKENFMIGYKCAVEINDKPHTQVLDESL